MKKRIILTISILVLFFWIKQVNASTIISLDTATGSVGDTVNLKLSLKDNPEFGLLGIKLSYDIEILEYSNANIIGLENAFMKDVQENNGIITMYALTLNELMNDTDTILNIEFKIKDTTAKSSEIEVRVTDFGVDETKSLEYETKNGFVYIKTTVSPNESVALQEEVTVDDDTNITWNSSNEDIATVDSEGNVTFSNDGEVTITATNEDGEEIYSKDYIVGEKKEENLKSNNYKIFIIIGIVICIIIIIAFIIFKKVHHE